MASDQQRGHSHEFEGSDSFDWSKYLAARPDYKASDFYKIVFDFHASRGNGWDLAHDVGTGPGNVAHYLALHFAQIQASDPNVAPFDETRISLHDKNVRIVESGGETLLEKTDPSLRGKADLIAAAEAIALMEPVKAIENFAGLLKPGGTLAIWFYGRPIFEDNKNGAREQQIFDRILTIAWSSLKPFSEVLERAWHTLTRWLDDMHFPADTWDNVHRIKWNSDKPLTFLPAEDLDFEVDSKSAIDAHENVEERIDRDFWSKRDVGIEWVQNYVEHQWPWKERWTELSKELEPLFSELEEAMGGRGSKTKISWPVVLILASRK